MKRSGRRGGWRGSGGKSRTGRRRVGDPSVSAEEMAGRKEVKRVLWAEGRSARPMQMRSTPQEQSCWPLPVARPVARWYVQVVKRHWDWDVDV